MTFPISLDTRRIIPRWRNSRLAVATGELALPAAAEKNLPHDLESILKKKLLWETNHEIEFAAELVSSALSLGIYSEAENAAEFIVENEHFVTPTVFAVAEELLIRLGKKPFQGRLDSIPEIVEINDIRTRIHNIRNSLIQYPRNAFHWVDLSQAYIILGQIKQSHEAMLRAIYLEPNNRYVLRSAARLFIHLDDPEHAHDLLTMREVTKKDPWLLAAEIATATVAGRTSKFIRQSKILLDARNHQPYHLAELASALGSIELTNGAVRNARKLFQTSLISPTENSVAQSVWAKQWINSLEIDNAINNTPRTFEAQTWNALLLLDWHRVVKAAQIWMADEPFSSKPAIFGSYAASVGLEDFGETERFSRIGLVANPTDHTLINNLAFSLAKQGKIDEAHTLLSNLSRPAPNLNTDIAIVATEGLIHFRKGEVEEGKAKYLQAIELSRRNSMPKVQAIASMYFAQEMHNSGQWNDITAISFAEEASKKVSGPDVTALLEKIKKLKKE
jgi:tetratricopeptide (TPR) repeat protein